MIYLYVLIFNLPVGENDKLLRHPMASLEACEKSLKTLVKTERNVVAYCAPEIERHYGNTWWKDKAEASK